MSFQALLFFSYSVSFFWCDY